MKRYRYLSSQRTGWRRYLPLLYFVSAWNLLGSVIWLKMKNKVKEDHPDFDNMTSAQKAALIYTGSEGNIKKISVSASGFSVNKKDYSKEEFLKVKKEED